jgi:hypothetical protein
MSLDKRSSMVVLTIVVVGLALAAGLVIPLASGGGRGSAAPTAWTPPATATATAVRPTTTVRPTLTPRGGSPTARPATATPTRPPTAALTATTAPTRPTVIPTQTQTRVAATAIVTATVQTTATVTPTVRATATVTATVRAAVTPVTTPPAGPTQTAPSSGAVIAQIREGPLTLRTSPSTDGGRFAMAQVGETYTVTARTNDSSWLQVCCIQGSPVWLSAQYVTITGTISTLPIKP